MLHEVCLRMHVAAQKTLRRGGVFLHEGAEPFEPNVVDYHGIYGRLKTLPETLLQS